MVDTVGQATSFTYINYTSTDVTSQHIEAIRPAGAGCTQENFMNYSPFATSEDNSCIEGRLLQIGFTSATGVTSPPDWYKYGFVDVLEPLILGGHVAFNPVFFTSANVSSESIVTILPGKFPIHAFGGAKAQVILVDTGDVLGNIDGSETTQQRDAHGFLSTLGDARVFFIVPETPITRQVVSSEGGVVGSSETGSVVVTTGALVAPTVIGVAVEEIAFSAASTLRNDGAAGGSRGAWDVVGKVFQITPHRQRFATPVTVVIPFDEGNQPTGKGNSETVVLRASDERGLDWRVVPGASFSGGKAYVEVDHFSLLAVAARADVRMMIPLQGRLTGGTVVTLDGVDFRGVPISSSSGNIFCKFGEHYQKAEFVDSQEPRGYGAAVVCAAPMFVEAGFTTVEMHDAGTLLSSNNDWRMLLTAAANVTGLMPASGPAMGGALVTVSGTQLSAASNDWVASRSGDSGGSGSRQPDAISCSFGDVDSPSSGYAISSAVAVCEAPAATLHTAAAQVRVRLSNDNNADASFVVFRYRAPLVDPAADFASSGDNTSPAIRQLVGNDEGGSVVDVGLFPGAMGQFGGDGSGGGGGTQAGLFAPTMRCLFGTVSVALRTAAGRGEGLHCVAPARSGLRRRGVIVMHRLARDLDGYSTEAVPVYITGAAGEPSIHIATFARLPAPRPTAVVRAVGGQLTGNYGVGGLVADIVLDRDHPSYPAAAVWGSASLRCVISGIPSPSARLPFPSIATYDGDVVSCRLAAGSQPGFVAISVLLDGTDAPAQADLTPVAQLLVPGDNSAAFTVAVAGGPACGGGGGGSVWLTGGNMVQHGIGGSWDDRNVGGFGWGTGSALKCRYSTAGGDVSAAGGGYGIGGGGRVNLDAGGGGSAGGDKEKLTHVSAAEGPAHVVSSALAVCEAPVLMDMDQQEKAVDEAAGVVAALDGDLSGVIVSAWVTSGGGSASIAANTSAVAFRVIPEPTLTSLSPLRGLQSGGGAVVTATWKAAAGFGRRPAPPQLACAFGTIMPVALVFHGSGLGGGGTCVSPAHAPTLGGRNRETQSDGELAYSGIPIWLHLPNSGRTTTASFKPSFHAAITTTPLLSWTLLPSATSAAGGGAFVPVGVLPKAVTACTFGLETSTRLQPHGGAVQVS
jgi:hypothetical protein